MKRFLSLFLTLLLALTSLTVLFGCGEAVGDPGVNEETSGDLSSGAEDTSSEVIPTEEPLPSSSTLCGTVHIPPISTQGGIGCCTSMGVTYMQFTIAVSQYIHSLDPDTDWNPSSGNEAYIFSPKFTYNFSGAGTEYCYNVLKDHGCLTLADTRFAGEYGPAIRSGDTIYTQTTEWCVSSGEMMQALTYRLLDFEEIEIGEGLSDANDYLIETVKRSISEGNAVAFCGWSSYWQSTAIDRKGTGTLGQKGDEAIYTSVIPEESTSDGNHCICIVGYDDDITLTVQGKTMKGAFQVANSWSDSYKNDGFVWIMYDAFRNQSAEVEDLNDAEYYNSTRSLSFENGELKLLTANRSTYSQKLNIRPVADGSTVSVGGKDYPVCTISLGDDSAYLAVSDGTVTVASAPGDTTSFLLIPYSDAETWGGFKATSADDSFKEDGYFICAVTAENADSITVNTKSFLRVDSTDSTLTVDRLQGGSNSFTCFVAKGYTSGSTLSRTRLSYAGSLGKDYTRTGVGYRFSFIDYRTDIEVGLPAAMVEVQLSSTKRENINISISRTDASGNVVTVVPAITTYTQSKTNQVYNDVAANFLFNGEVSDGETMDTAYFTLGYNDLSKLMDGYELENFLWGVTVKGSGNLVEKITLKNAAGEVLLESVLPDGGTYLEKGDSVDVLMDLGGELKEYSADAEGVRRIVSVSDGKYLSKKVMFFELLDEATDDGIYEIKESEDGALQFYLKGSNYLFDITGTEIADGVVVKFNAPNAKKNTQTWKTVSAGDGSFYIALAADPTYVICNDPEKGIVLTNKNTTADACKWRFLPVSEDAQSSISVKQEESSLTVSGVLPAKTAETGLTLEIVRSDGERLTSVDVTAADGAYTATVEKPESGSYLIRLVQNGAVLGTQCLYKVK